MLILSASVGGLLTDAELLKSDLKPDTEVVEKIYQLLKEEKEKKRDSHNVLYEVLYVGANTVGSVVTYIAISTIADKISSDWKVRSAIRIGGGLTSIAAGAFIRKHMRDNTALRMVGNSLIGGGTLATISGIINIKKALK